MNYFSEHQIGDVFFYTSQNIPVKHGFSTRRGGVSALPHTATMNLAFGRGDKQETVLQNLALFCGALNIDPHTIVSAKQIHSSLIQEVGPADCGTGKFALDGFVTKEEGVALCIKIADCVPILFCDPVNRVIGACHAGWRGTAAGIAPKTVAHMCRLGAAAVQIQAAIGPCIHACCYEVSDDFYQSVAALRGSAFAAKWIQPAENGKYHADLAGMNQSLLIEAGLPDENISISTACTCCRPDLYFSHRATGGLRGTMAAIISL